MQRRVLTNITTNTNIIINTNIANISHHGCCWSCRRHATVAAANVADGHLQLPLPPAPASAAPAAPPAAANVAVAVAVANVAVAFAPAPPQPAVGARQAPMRRWEVLVRVVKPLLHYRVAERSSTGFSTCTCGVRGTGVEVGG